MRAAEFIVESNNEVTIGTVVASSNGTTNEYFIFDGSTWSQISMPTWQEGQQFAQVLPNGKTISHDELMSLPGLSLVYNGSGSDRIVSFFDLEGTPVNGKIMYNNKVYTKTNCGWRTEEGKEFGSEYMISIAKSKEAVRV